MNLEDNKKLTILIFINIIYIFVGSYMFSSQILPHDIFSYGMYILLLINCIMGIILIKKGIVKKNIIYSLFFLLILFGIISTIFAKNKIISLLGFDYRDEGLLMLIYYYSLAFLSSNLNSMNKKKIIIIVLIIGLIEALYAICQIFEMPFVCISYNPEKSKIKVETGYRFINKVWATGFKKNPNFFGTYMLICLSYAIGLYLNEKEKINNILYIILCIFLSYALIISNTLSCIVGLIAVLIFTIVYSIIDKKIKKIIIVIFSIILSLSIACFQNKTTVLRDLKLTGGQSIEIAKGNLDDTYGTKRMFIWKNTIKVVPKHILHGVGIDNFYFAFDDSHLTYSNGKKSYDKAHNEYLQILICEGIFALITYLIIYFKIVYTKLKTIKKDKELYLLLPVIGYLIQAFFNISVIEVAPIFFITLGMCINNINEKNKL